MYVQIFQKVINGLQKEEIFNQIMTKIILILIRLQLTQIIFTI